MIDTRDANRSRSLPPFLTPHRRLPLVGCLLLGAAGLFGAVKLEARAVGADSAPPPPTATKSRAAGPKERSSATKEHGAPEPPESEVDLPTVVTVPDFKGKRLSVAMRQARKLGLVLVATGSQGGRIPPELAADYRVRRQETPANTTVEPGTAVEVRVRESVDVAQGY
jgi:hypothetical protein